MKKITKLIVVLCIVLLCGITKTFAQHTITLNLTDQMNDIIQAEKQKLNTLQSQICTKVTDLTSDVQQGGSGGVLIYPNWVRFVQIAQGIDELNEQWNEAYGDALAKLVEQAFNLGLTNADPNNEHEKDLLADIIEEEQFIFNAYIASVCFEKQFSFILLRKCLEDQEDNWLENADPNNLDASQAPTIAENIDDEEYWTLINCERQYTILNTNVDETMLNGLSNDQKKDILATIKDIVGVLGSVVTIAEQISNLLEDCAGSTVASERDVRDGIPVDAEHKIGYVMRQRGVLFDFNTTYTKIKGKAKLWRINKRGKWKKDRNNIASLGYCALEANGCDGGEWPANGVPFRQWHHDKRKKIKIRDMHPFALQINNSNHFLQFNFGRNRLFVDSRILLGYSGCTPVSTTQW